MRDGDRRRVAAGVLPAFGSFGSTRDGAAKWYRGSGMLGTRRRRAKRAAEGLPAAGGALLRLREHGRRGLGFWGGGGVELRTQGPGWGLIKGPRASWGGAPRERPAGIAAVIAGGRCGRRGTSLASGAHESASAASGTSGRASVRLALTSWAQVAGAGRMQAVAERVKAGAWLKPMSGRCARWEAERS